MHAVEGLISWEGLLEKCNQWVGGRREAGALCGAGQQSVANLTVCGRQSKTLTIKMFNVSCFMINAAHVFGNKTCRRLLWINADACASRTHLCN